VTREILL
jgi:hypothetical protein